MEKSSTICPSLSIDTYAFSEPRRDRAEAALEALVEAEAVVDRGRASASFEHRLDRLGPVLDARGPRGRGVVAVARGDDRLDLGELGQRRWVTLEHAGGGADPCPCGSLPEGPVPSHSSTLAK